MSSEYTYYRDGFFGYGPDGTFRAYTLMHFMPILVTVGLLILVWYGRRRLREWKGETHLRFLLSFAMFVMEFSYFCWLLYVGDDSGKNLMMAKLPLHVCDMGLICCMFMVPSKNRTLFGIKFFITLFGATLSCIVPQTVLTNVGPMHYRYYQFFGEHLIPIFGTVYMMTVHGMRPRYRDIWISVGVLSAMLVPSLALNEAYPGSDYLFLKLDLPLLPDDQYLRAGIYAVLITAVFHVMWLLWRLYLRGREKRAGGNRKARRSGIPETDS